MAVVKDKYRGTPSYQLVYEELLSAAKSRGTVTYKKIAQIMDLPYLSGNYMSGEVGQILGEIAEDEYDQNRPLLTAVAVLTSGGAGGGFFTLSRELGLLEEGLSKEADQAYWVTELEAVYDVYSKATTSEGRAAGDIDTLNEADAARIHDTYSEDMRLQEERYEFARNPSLVRAAKKHYGCICKACGFDFAVRYGEIGAGYIECHHLHPEIDRSEGVSTRLEDVTVLCANCHRMIHSRRPALALEELLEALISSPVS